MPDIQVQVAWALLFKGNERGHLGEFEQAIASYDAVIERFGASDVSNVQSHVATALVGTGITRGHLGASEQAIATYDEVVERFGASDMPDIQVQVAWALFFKGNERGRLGASEQAIVAYDDVIERFGASESPKLHYLVAKTLVHKSLNQIEVDRTEEALQTCEELEQRLGILPDDESLVFEWRAMWVRTKALLVQEKHRAAMDTFRSAHAMFVPGNETMMREMLWLVPDLIAVGASERDLVEILSSDKAKSDTLLPLVVALRQRAGEVVREPAEVLEVAEDIRARIKAKTATETP